MKPVRPITDICRACWNLLESGSGHARWVVAHFDIRWTACQRHRRSGASEDRP